MIPGTPLAVSTVVVDGISYRVAYVVTATKETEDLARLRVEAAAMDLPCNVLGMDPRAGPVLSLGPDNKREPWRFSLKLDHEDAACRQLDEADLLLYTDAYDVVPVDSLPVVVAKYLSLDADLVVSGETGLWPAKRWSLPYPPSADPFPYLNSGGMMGTARAFRAVFDQHAYEETADDQAYWTRVYLEGTRGISLRLDTRAELFLSLFGAQVGVDVDKRPIAVATGTHPSFVHANGGKANFSMDGLSRFLRGESS